MTVSVSKVKIRVLVVEDSEDDAALIVRALGQGGYAPEWRRVDTREKMRAALDDKPWDVVIADFKMPGFSGLEALRLLRERASDVPFILASGVIGEERAVEAMRAGAQDYVMKRNLARLAPAITRELREAEVRRQRHRAEDALHRQLLFTRALSESIGEGVCAIDRRGKLTFANPAAQRMLAWPEAELVGRDLHEIAHPDRAQPEQGACPILEVIRSHASYHSEDDVLRKKDGAMLPVSLTVSPLTNGAADGAVLAFQDITERKRTLEAEMFLARASEALAELLDYERALVRAASLCVPEIADACVMTVDEGNGEYARAVVVRDEGEPRVTHHAAQPDQELEWDGDSVRVAMRSRGRAIGTLLLFVRGDRGLPDVALAQEVAHRAAMAIDNASLYREAQQAIRVRDEFVSIASHELRTPLTPLRLQIQDLLERARKKELTAQPPERVTARLESAARQVDRVARLVANLLDVTRIAAGRITLEREPVELVTLVREVLERADPEVQRGRYQVKLESEGAIVGRWDRLRIEQAVTNLVSNALKYGEGKPIDVVVARDGPRALVRVRDRGIGIAPAELDRVFGRFERAVSERSYGGLGLGLYIVRRFVEAHGGEVNVESRVGEGSSFTIELPLEE